MMIEKLEQLKQQRDENFIKLGQYQLQKKYYEDKIKNLLEHQEHLCDKIYKIIKEIN